MTDTASPPLPQPASPEINLYDLFLGTLTVGIFGVITSFLSQVFLAPSKKQIAEQAEEQARVRNAAKSELDMLQNQLADVQGELTEIKLLLKDQLANGKQP